MPSNKTIRLQEFEVKAILNTVKKHDSHAKVYLYGSRTQSELKGGDIDLLVESETITFSQKLEIMISIKESIGDQRIDLKVHSASAMKEDLFVQHLFKSNSPILLENCC